jgi:hypothetical protein
MAHADVFLTERKPLSLRIAETFRQVRDLAALIAAAGRVGWAVEAHEKPSPRDLALIGLSDAKVLRPPYRF